ncbi:hypothetical protein J576_2213 [Acinetobacter sp. 766875]|nr:hypothetical protein J576_2213 [Acinetobacter sp. 766875]
MSLKINVHFDLSKIIYLYKFIRFYKPNFNNKAKLFSLTFLMI